MRGRFGIGGSRKGRSSVLRLLTFHSAFVLTVARRGTRCRLFPEKTCATDDRQKPTRDFFAVRISEKGSTLGVKGLLLATGGDSETQVPSDRAIMPIVCGSWTVDIQNLGYFEFDSVPRSGDSISLPNEPGPAHTHYKVKKEVHWAAAPHQPTATFLFVASEPDLA